MMCGNQIKSELCKRLHIVPKDIRVTRRGGLVYGSVNVKLAPSVYRLKGKQVEDYLKSQAERMDIVGIWDYPNWSIVVTDFDGRRFIKWPTDEEPSNWQKEGF